MTLPYERSRAVIQTRDFLLELSSNRALPWSIQQEAHRLLRHYPTARDVFRGGRQELIDPKFVLEPVFSTNIDD